MQTRTQICQCRCAHVFTYRNVYVHICIRVLIHTHLWGALPRLFSKLLHFLQGAEYLTPTYFSRRTLQTASTSLQQGSSRGPEFRGAPASTLSSGTSHRGSPFQGPGESPSEPSAHRPARAAPAPGPEHPAGEGQQVPAGAPVGRGSWSLGRERALLGGRGGGPGPTHLTGVLGFASSSRLPQFHFRFPVRSQGRRKREEQEEELSGKGRRSGRGESQAPAPAASREQEPAPSRGCAQRRGPGLS